MSSDIKLLPCPFCGGEGSAYMDRYDKYFTGCEECKFYYGIEIEHDCELEDGWLAIHDSKEEAIKAWNTRKPMDRIVEQLEERKALWEDKSVKDKSSAEKHIGTWNVAIEIVKAGGKV